MARLAKAGRQEPVVGLVDRGVSVAGGAAQEGLTAAKRACPEMAPQRIEKVESAPGNGMASAASDPRIWRRERHQRRPEHSVSPDGRGDEGHARRAGFRNAAARRPQMAPQELEIIESAPGNGMASQTSRPQDPARGAMAQSGPNHHCERSKAPVQNERPTRRRRR